MHIFILILFLLFGFLGVFAFDGIVSYFLFAINGLLVGSFVAKGLIDTKKDKSDVAGLIKIFAGFGIAVSIFGMMFLIYTSTNDFYNDKNQWDLIEKIDKSTSLEEQKKYEKKENFNPETLKFNDDTSQTIGIIFTIAGIALGTLGVLWLGHLESTRLRKDREHDQQVQKDRLLSLLSLGIDLFLYIDKKEIDFVYESKDQKYKHHKYNAIEWNGVYYFLLTQEIIKDDTNLQIAYERHLTSLYKFLYQQKNLHKNSILSDVHKIIDELKILYYEKDMLLYLSNEEKKELNQVEIEKQDNEYHTRRNIFIKLLKQFNDYNNFLEGKTAESDFAISEYEAYDKKLSTLLNSTMDEKKSVFDFLNEKFNDCAKTKKVFFEYFCESASKEFSELYLIQESDIFSVFQLNELKDIFLLMGSANLNVNKFFNAYLKNSFREYTESKKEYQEIDLSKNDLSIDEYVVIFHSAFLQIYSDVKSVKELYSLFYSFVALYKEYSEGSSNE